MSRNRLALLAAAFSLTGGAALALTTQEVIDSLRADGYTRIEVKTGPTQMKVEAIRGTEKREVVYDSATGTILKSEVETVRPGENTAPGVSIRDRDRDFVRDRRSDDNGSSDDDSASNDDDDDSGKGRGRGRGRDGGDDDSDDDGDDDSDDDGDDDGDDDHDDDSGNDGDDD